MTKKCVNNGIGDCILLNKYHILIVPENIY